MPTNPPRGQILMEVDIAFKTTKAFRALQVVFDVMEDLAEDFEYRDDIKRAVKACRYLSNNVELVERMS